MQRDMRTMALFALFAAALWCSWLVLRPFVPGMVWAAVLVCAFKPLHARLTTRLRGRAWAASTVVTLLVAAFVVVPTVLAGIQVAKGTAQIYNWVQATYDLKGPDFGANEKLQQLDEKVSQTADIIGIDLGNVDYKAVTQDALKKAAAFVAVKAPGMVGTAFGLTFSFLVMLLMMFPLFAKGDAVAESVAKVLPFPTETANRIMSDLGLMTRTVFISAGLTAAIQAALCAFAYLVLRVPNALPLGAATFFFAILPAGPALVWIPVAIYLAATGHMVKAILLTGWGLGVVGTIDNFLRPFFAKDGVNLPTTLLFLGLLGGLMAFGLVGLFIGPIVLYVLIELSKAMKLDA